MINSLIGAISIIRNLKLCLLRNNSHLTTYWQYMTAATTTLFHLFQTSGSILHCVPYNIIRKEEQEFNGGKKGVTKEKCNEIKKKVQKARDKKGRDKEKFVYDIELKDETCFGRFFAVTE